jgi:hypothetical protein
MWNIRGLTTYLKVRMQISLKEQERVRGNLHIDKSVGHPNSNLKVVFMQNTIDEDDQMNPESRKGKTTSNCAIPLFQDEANFLSLAISPEYRQVDTPI